jgi:N-acetylglucosaminyl-diphospho-decaprenol L-rhamnosyltransferase
MIPPKDLHLRDVSIVIPVMNGRAVLERSLAILERNAGEAEVIVVDGGSTDGALELAKSKSWVRVLEVPNHGWAHANNRGFEFAARPLLMTMNSDLYPTRAALTAMAARLRGVPGVAAVGPSLRNEDGSKQRAFTPFYWPNWVTVQKPSSVPVLHGACLMTRRDVLERVHGFDEGFFLYNEELDWCTRVRRAGFRLELLPETVTHVGGASTGDRTALIELEEHRGFLRFLEKNHPGLPLEVAAGAVRVRAWLGARTDSRTEFRPVWTELERLVSAREFNRSPFLRSGRSEVVFHSKNKMGSEFLMNR